MNGRDDLDKFFSHISDNLFKYGENEEFPKYFRNSYLAGDNTLYQKNIAETKIFDDEWITTMESYFPSIDKITRNPRSFIKYVEDVVDIERAKKTNSRSIRHLSQHTEYVREVDKDQNVTPSKILSTSTEQEFDVYENRFIATLINRMFLFVRNRLEVIRVNVESFQKDHFSVTSKFNIAESEAEMKIDLVVKRDLDNKTINEHNHDLLDRAEKLSILIDGLKGSQFMTMMRKTKPIHPPIMKTNVILKNPDFRNAYTLWLFMDKYSTLGYDVKVDEKDLEFDTKFKKYVDDLIMVNFATILGNQIRRQRKYNATEYETYIKKRKKTTHKNDDDYIDNPEAIAIEDNNLNEYFLTKYKKIFDKTVEEMEADGEVRHEEAIRRAIRKATDIVNGIFESIFRLEEDNDIFRKLVEKTDVNKDYEIKRNQLKYAKIIREVKEVDYNKATRLERRLIKELEKINVKFIKLKMQEKAKADKSPVLAQIEIDIKRLKEENKEYDKRLIELNNLEVLRDEEKNAISIVREEAVNKARDDLKAYEKELKKKEDLEKVAARKEVKREERENKRNRAREAKAFAIRQEKITKKIESEHNKIMVDLEKEKQALEARLEEKLAKEKAIEDRRRAQEQERERRRKELEEQKERERIAIMKVKAYEEQAEKKAEIKKLRSKL